VSLAIAATAAPVLNARERARFPPLYFITLLINNFIYAGPTIAGKSFVTLTVKSNIGSMASSQRL